MGRLGYSMTEYLPNYSVEIPSRSYAIAYTAKAASNTTVQGHIASRVLLEPHGHCLYRYGDFDFS